MGRTEYCNDPSAPKADTLIPASNLLVADETGAILLQRRRGTGQWALPGGAQGIGETAAECAVRKCLEETGIIAELTEFLGVYTNPNYIVVQPADFDQYDIHPSMRQQIGDYLAGTYPCLG
ncbi:NUDIX domain-containing protein [Streptomyces lichenis]|uniref:NUDIX domain-containing protein n=1 Tax=Streptomyces lichenis TaxID=2306967 RepID=A0ABT0I9E1_9ACTN|nr:NUDIX domain-containing protein [Streptomyces lichenis]MCK8677939.1 NUDIX domain-containing protein [Streptomyces lichenis]